MRRILLRFSSGERRRKFIKAKLKFGLPYWVTYYLLAKEGEINK
jgi:hypothetical protein